MIESLIKIAADTKFYGLKDNYTHKCKLKNKKCGDKITVQIIVKNKIINKMRYETESCVYCEASASLLAKSIVNTDLNDFLKQLNVIKGIFSNSETKFPIKFRNFQNIISIDNENRKDCILLPFYAAKKALKL